MSTGFLFNPLLVEERQNKNQCFKPGGGGGSVFRTTLALCYFELGYLEFPAVLNYSHFSLDVLCQSFAISYLKRSPSSTISRFPKDFGIPSLNCRRPDLDISKLGPIPFY